MMKLISISMLVLFPGLVGKFMHSPTNEKADAILGEWVNEEGNAKFNIYKSQDRYFGEITWGTGGDTKDSNNPDPKLRGKNLVGMTILKDFKFDGKNTWSEGSIYDPKDGKTYSCKLTLKSGDKLEVRGYVGISLFGRSETWSRFK
ncbi:DUF2147 domain-containing protein [Pararhodonellum marinum]|uniref:DUF2147 domain-containing protein n=1 Tax=Pararhodonellum marinum TaxID=2755358 RepID=UPI001890AA60|nr:DUF2147 domain-containing protein [Pararhodonellum marinum]